MKTIRTAGLFFLLALFCGSVCTAQSGVVKKGYAFAQPATYGRELKGLDGQSVKRPDSLYFIYLEVKGTEQPQFTSIRYQGKSFTASVVPVEEKKVTVGVQKSNGKTVTLQRSSGYSLWRIELEPVSGMVATSKGIVATGKAGSRPLVFSQAKWIILKPEIKP